MAKHKLTEHQKKVWDRLNYVPPSITNRAWAYSASHTPPSSALPGSIYHDLNSGNMMLYDGTTWKKVI